MSLLKNLIYSLAVFTLFCLTEIQVNGQLTDLFWVQFSNKDSNLYLLKTPEKVLSERSIKRRLKNNVVFDETDLPVCSYFTDSLTRMGIIPIYTSKWFNGTTVAISNLSDTIKLKNCSFVKKIEKTYDKSLKKSSKFANKNSIRISTTSNFYSDPYYGNAYYQIILQNGISIHNKGFKGKDIQIAIIDAGFLNANYYYTLEKARIENRILGQRDFVEPENNVYNSFVHGAAVLSIIGANLPGKMVGTAPDASFWLLRSENGLSEYPVEEDNWIAAAEFADSVGADIINTSLGYSEFDNTNYNHTYKTMNGTSTRVSLAANMAALKGMVVVVSAGNEGTDKWHYLSAPADAKNILTVGATDINGKKAPFSSYGPAADGRVKPEICAMGANNYFENSPDSYLTGSGTSFSAPVITGLTACLLQAFPNASAQTITNMVIKSAKDYNSPNDSTGYGIPDFNVAYELIQNSIQLNISTTSNSGNAYPNPFNKHVVFDSYKNFNGFVNIECWNINGKLIFKSTKSNKYFVDLSSEIQSIDDGVYLFKFRDSKHVWTVKAVKFSGK
jgi:serine protease AprX